MPKRPMEKKKNRGGGGHRKVRVGPSVKDEPSVPPTPSAAWLRMKEKGGKGSGAGDIGQPSRDASGGNQSQPLGPSLLPYSGVSRNEVEDLKAGAWDTAFCGCKGQWREIQGLLWWRPIVPCVAHAAREPGAFLPPAEPPEIGRRAR